MCPAAASSTVYMFTSMTLGYIAQSLIHHEIPDAITLTGAALMVLAVILMSVPKRGKHAEHHEAKLNDTSEEGIDVSSAEEGLAGPVQFQVPGQERIIACFCTEASGHLNPMLALASGLIHQGWKVHFYCPKPARQAVEGVGAMWCHMGKEDLDIYELAANVITTDLGMEDNGGAKGGYSSSFHCRASFAWSATLPSEERGSPEAEICGLRCLRSMG